MTWGKLGPLGWGKGKAEGDSQGWLRQVIHTILEVVPGGVLRAGKKRYTDDATAGWWLGVDADGVPRFNIGDAAQFLKWTGELLRVRGDLTLAALLGKFEGGGVVWEDADGVPVFTIGADADLGFLTGLSIAALHPAGLRITSEGSLTLTSVTGAVDVLFNRVINVADATAAGDAVSRSFGDGRYLQKGAGLTLAALLGKFDGGGVVWEDADGDPVFSIGADADLGFITGLSIAALHPVGLSISSEGSLTLTSVTGAVDVLFNRVINVADATADEDALNRRTGDGRYLRKAAGWSGSFATGDGRTVTVADGQITNVG